MKMGSEALSPTPPEHDSVTAAAAAAAAAEAMFAKRGCCCFWVPWPQDTWERIRPQPAKTASAAAAAGDGCGDRVGAAAGGPTSRGWWWDRGVRALRKVREWSEVVAGPRWKTFLRRLGRRRRGGAGARFGYDPLSYARNFEESNGGGGGGGGDDDSDEDAFRRGFSVRYAPASAKSSMDLGDLPVAGVGGGGGEVVPWTRFTAPVKLGP